MRCQRDPRDPNRLGYLRRRERSGGLTRLGPSGCDGGGAGHGVVGVDVDLQHGCLPSGETVGAVPVLHNGGGGGHQSVGEIGRVGGRDLDAAEGSPIRGADADVVMGRPAARNQAQPSVPKAPRGEQRVPCRLLAPLREHAIHRPSVDSGRRGSA